MMWYEMTGKDSDVVVSSRVRLARNIVDYPFEGRLDTASAEEIIKRVKKVFENDDSYKFIDFSSLTETERAAAAESHKVSPEFAAKKTPCALIESDSDQVYIMVLEEDHIRIQTILAGFSLDEAYRRAAEVDDRIDSAINIAYDEKLGYLTHCPTNLGTGMRASVMMFLPAITYAGGIRALQNQLGKIGLTIRGMSGEGSAADGYLFQISNQVTLGTTEEETLSKIAKITEKIIEQERGLRDRMVSADKDRLTDRIMRSYGTMLYATLIDTVEMLRLYSDVRLGASLGIIDCVKTDQLDEMLIRGMPATLMQEHDDIKTTTDRDRARADMIRRVLNKNAAGFKKSC